VKIQELVPEESITKRAECIPQHYGRTPVKNFEPSKDSSSNALHPLIIILNKNLTSLLSLSLFGGGDEAKMRLVRIKTYPDVADSDG
jgi:hypothetical protein